MFASLRLAQVLRPPMSAFCSTLLSYMHLCLDVERWFQYPEGLGTTAHTFEELLFILDNFFACIRRAGLKVTTPKFEIGSTEINFLQKNLFQRKNGT